MHWAVKSSNSNLKRAKPLGTTLHPGNPVIPSVGRAESERVSR